MKRKKNGFSMIEIVTTIAILGILTLVAVGSISYMMRRAEQNYYKTQKNNMISAARSYLQANKDLLPKVNGQHSQEISLSRLQGAKYIDTVKDYHKEACNVNTSYVKVFKYKNNYDYSAYLECPNYTNDDDPSDSKEIKINVSFSGDISNPKSDIKITNDDGIISYVYRIYTGTSRSNLALVYTSDTIDAGEQKTVNKTLSLKKYSDRWIKIEVSAINIHGKIGLGSGDTDQFISKPQCPRSSDIIGQATGSSDWVIGSDAKRKITVPCSDLGSGCTKDSFTVQFDYNATTAKVIITDKAGNKSECNVNVYIEKSIDAPTITGGGSWSISDTTISVSKAASAISGVKNYQYCTSNTDNSTGCTWKNLGSGVKKQTFSEEGIYYVFFRAISNAGNTSKASNSRRVMIEKNITKPTITGGSNSWKGSVTISVSTPSVALSGVDYYQYCKSATNSSSGCTWTKITGTSKTFTDLGDYYIFFRGVSVAGNKSGPSNSQRARVEDTITAPTIAGGSSSWYKTNRIIWVSRDSVASQGLSYYEYCTTDTNSSSGCSWKKLSNNTNGAPSGVDIAYYHATNTDLINAFGGNVEELTNHWNNYGKNENRKKSDSSWLRSAQNFNTEGEYYVFFRGVSKGGTKSSASNSQRLRIEKTVPTRPTIKGENTTYSPNYRIIWASNLSTAKSGIDHYEYCTSSSSSGCYSWSRLYNNSGGAPSGVDIAYYHANNNDLISSFGGDVSQLAAHWNNYGKKENRKKSDSSWVRTAQNFYNNTDVYVYFRAVSKAGNVSTASNSQRLRYINGTPTKPTITGGVGSWQNANRIIWVTSESTTPVGLSKYQYCQSSSSSYCTGSWRDLYNNFYGAGACDDIAYYHMANNDLKSSFGGSVAELSNHYSAFGIREGRKCSNSSWFRNAQNITDQGHYYVFFRAISKTNMESPISNSQQIYIDKIAPSTPSTVTMKKQDGSNYGDNTWSNTGYVNISASGSTDDLSGVSYYEFKLNNNYVNGTFYRGTGQIGYEGTSTINYRACDRAGNCSGFTSRTIKLDRTPPYFSSITAHCGNPWAFGGYTSYVLIYYGDSLSGVNTRHVVWTDAAGLFYESTGYSDSPNPDTLAGRGSWQAYKHEVWDNAGNYAYREDQRVNVSACSN